MSRASSFQSDGPEEMPVLLTGYYGARHDGSETKTFECVAHHDEGKVLEARRDILCREKHCVKELSEEHSHG